MTFISGGNLCSRQRREKTRGHHHREEQEDAICNLAEEQDGSSSHSEGNVLFIFESASKKGEGKNMQVIKA